MPDQSLIRAHEKSQEKWSAHHAIALNKNIKLLIDFCKSKKLTTIGIELNGKIYNSDINVRLDPIKKTATFKCLKEIRGTKFSHVLFTHPFRAEFYAGKPFVPGFEIFGGIGLSAYELPIPLLKLEYQKNKITYALSMCRRSGNMSYWLSIMNKKDTSISIPFSFRSWGLIMSLFLGWLFYFSYELQNLKPSLIDRIKNSIKNWDKNDEKSL
ncbi:unnamed protein product [Blepharisma stoltei]|uniref:Uncharacterized protein n=1 Tax=Blepharisma stoltei TaxID=1481888 RepID=A0AAU9J0S9_9CILI|nr:unnamed protein product [Blepharisma stoltei]